MFFDEGRRGTKQVEVEGRSVLGTVGEAGRMGITDCLRRAAVLWPHPFGKKLILETWARM